jgi:hypothetical protein
MTGAYRGSLRQTTSLGRVVHPLYARNLRHHQQWKSSELDSIAAV